MRMIGSLAGSLSLLAGLGIAAPAFGQFRINEIRIDQPAADNDEYFEIAGPAGLTLTNVWYVVIGDQPAVTPPAQNGSIEAVVNLSGSVIPADGVLLVAKASFSFGVPDITAAFTFEELDNVTHLLVTGFSGSNGQDLDTNNDGTLDVTPWSGILDSVALVINPTPNGVSADFFYSETVVGPDGAFSPSQVWRCTDTLEWVIGTFNFTGTDSPGAPNPECSEGPEVQLNEIRIDQPGTDADNYFELRGNPNGSLNGLAYLVIGDDDDALLGSGVIEDIIPLDGLSLNINGFFLAAADDNTFGALADLFVADLDFEGSDNVTHLLVQGFTGVINDDLDTDDDGTLDVTPWDLLVDAVALLETAQPPTGANEWTYAKAQVGPEGPFVPGHVYRCAPDNEWQIGPFDSTNGVDTPGAANPECLICGIPGSGSCFTEHAATGCEDAECCTAVCDVDPTCCDTGWDAECVTQANTLCLAGGTPPPVLINEMRVDQTGTDNDEYFELVGPPGTSLEGVTYIVIGDGTGASGVIESVTALDGFSIGASGRFVVAEPSFTLGVADLVVGANGLNFENTDTVTHLIVFNFIGANGADLDTNDDGVLDSTPWQSVIDSIALLDDAIPPAGDFGYSTTTLGPDGTFPPSHAYRCSPDGTWTLGAFDTLAEDTPGAENSTCEVTVVCGNPNAEDCFTAQRTPGCSDGGCCELVCATDPGCCEVAWDDACVSQAGKSCLIGGDPPAASLNEIRVDEPSTDNNEYAEIAAAPGTSLAGVTYLVIGDGTAALGSGVIEAVVDLSSVTVGASGLFVISESTFTLGTADLVVGATGLNFENSDNVTHLLVFNFTGANGQDLDGDNDGLLDATPWTAVIDQVGLIGGNFPPDAAGEEWAYGDVLVGPDVDKLGNFVPGHIYRCVDAGDWIIGTFEIVDGQDTPGDVNPDCEDQGDPCPFDLNDDGLVDGGDYGLLLGQWGFDGSADFNGDDLVDGADSGLLLGAWGPCPPK